MRSDAIIGSAMDGINLPMAIVPSLFSPAVCFPVFSMSTSFCVPPVTLLESALPGAPDTEKQRDL